MPELRCIAEECERRWVDASVAVGGPCPECGTEGAVLVTDEDDVEQLDSFPKAGTEKAPTRSVARKAAQALLRETSISGPPVPVRDIAQHLGLGIAVRDLPDAVRGRLVDMTIEVNQKDAAVAQRFTIAHEIEPP